MPEDMTISAYDVEVMRHQQKEAERRHGRAIARWKYGSMSVGYIAAAGAAVGGAWILWQAMAGPSASELLEHEQKIECAQEGGTWVTLHDGNQGGSGACVMGEVQEP